MVNRINGFSGMDIDGMVKSMMATKRVPLDKMNQNKQLMEWKRDSYRDINSKLYDFRNNKLIDKFGISAALNANKATVTGNTTSVKAEALAAANGIDMEVIVTKLAEKATIKTAGVGSNLNSDTTLATLNSKLATPVTEPYTLEINGESFTFESSTRISQVVAKINANTKAEVTASYDEVKGQLILTSTNNGSEGELKLGTNHSLLDLFKGYSGPATVKGTDSEAIINGETVKRSSNMFVINGVQLTLLEKTGTQPASKITTQIDSEKPLETIKSFIEEYNKLISTMNTKVNEAKYRDFTPLTDEQKKDMEESDIKAWTEKSKSGLLKNDDILKASVQGMRMVITESLGALSEIGITTGTYSENGKLILDETKFKEALNKNPQKIVDLFQGPASEPSTGLFDKLAEKVSGTLQDLSDRAGTDRFSASLTGTYKTDSVMGKRLEEYNARIKTLQKNLTMIETRYYNQFTAMEKAISKLNSQSSSLLSSLGTTS
ncbi:flagellar filament capping protein FliD [Paenibacillus sp. CN-4]|uniref:flagellar filament capping protein FliD n=1 Tax=Paenibacillus nanchangensis TaxID=3348343 RepID=UPI003978DE47